MGLAIFAKRNEPFNHEKAMNARFASRCPVCHGEIREGDPVYYSPLNKKARHQNCCEQTGRTLAQIVVDYINSHDDLVGGPYDRYSAALSRTLAPKNSYHKLAVDLERTRPLPEAWVVFADGSALRPMEGDPDGRFEVYEAE